MSKVVSSKDLIVGIAFFFLSFFINFNYADSAGICQLPRDKGGFGGECTWWSCNQGYTQVNDSNDCMPGWVCCVKKEDKAPQAVCSGICRNKCESGEIEDSYGSRSCPVTVAYQQVCCVKDESQLSKNKPFDPQNPPTKQPQEQPKQETPSTPGRSPITSGDTSSNQLVPCTDNCTLCHLYVGVHRIYTYLVWNLLYWIAATTIVIAGVLYMVSTGSKLIDAAKRALQYGIGGFLIAVCSWLIITIIMNALGATNAGSWYTFSCDTTPSSEAMKSLISIGGDSGTNKGDTPGSSMTKKSGQDLPYRPNRTPGPEEKTAIAQSINKYWNIRYVSDKTDCSWWTQQVMKDALGWDPGRDTLSQMKNSIPFDRSQLVDGTILISNNGLGGRHAVIYYNGMIYHNSSAAGGPTVKSLDDYIKWATDCGNFRMRLPYT